MDLLEICNDRIFDKSYMIKLSLNTEYRDLIKAHTDWMDSTTPFKIRCLAIHNGFTAINFPKCVVCSKPVTYNKSYQDKFSDYCSSQCSRSHKHRLPPNCYDKLNNYTWLYEQRITLKKSYEDIANSLGCSEEPVRKACKALNIPRVRHNTSEPMILLKLQDKEWLEQKHCVQRMTVEQIAEEIGSSKATVSRWLNYHEIVTNKSNSYPRQFNRISKQQQTLVDLISSIIPKETITTNDRSVLNGKELDIYIPQRKLAIEYNGVFHHVFRPEQSNEALRKDRNYHISKTLECQDKGIRLIHIFSDDWIYKQDIWKSILMHLLAPGSGTKTYARKLSIRVPTNPEKKEFLNINHLQGADKSCIAYGLYDGELPIALMTFCKSRYNKNVEWELSRFCVRMNYSCVGGFSRLLKHFQKNHTGKIISYADFSRSQGNVYLKNGFKLVKRNPPSYHYVNLSKNEKRMHRSNFTKTKMNIPDNITEMEFMENQGYRRIYDCGTLVFTK